MRKRQDSKQPYGADEAARGCKTRLDWNKNMSLVSIVNTIGRVAWKFSGRPLEVTSKVLGVVTAGSVAYDMHINGKEKAIVTDRIETADRYEKNYRQHMLLDKQSQTIADCKNAWFDMQKTFSWLHILSSASGYFMGAAQTILGNLPELALSAVALRTKNHKILGKAAGIMLGINMVKTLMYDITGVVKDKE